MPIVIKTRREIDMMRRAGVVAHQILNKMSAAAVAGASTAHLDQLARAELEAVGGISLSRNYPTYKPNEGFPGYTCISVNEEVVHGIPGKRILQDGDVVTLDLAMSLNGYCCDTATTVAVGRISSDKRKLLNVTEETLKVAIQTMKPGKKWSEVARLMQYEVEKAGFSVVREFVGHGIGRTMHEDPKVANFVSPEQLRADFKLRPGMTLAVEPMVVAGHRDVVLLDDGWTVITKDRSPAAHYEHTIAVTDTGIEILTDGKPPASL
jgi:methionyl aminopeptidase